MFGIIERAALAWWASRQTIGKPRVTNSFHSHTGSGPVSMPILATFPAFSASQSAIVS
ncbi:hypothetical protein NKH83_30520 [Mesorhizobium sp. M0909]